MYAQTCKIIVPVQYSVQKKGENCYSKMSSSDEMKLKPTHYTKMHYVG